MSPELVMLLPWISSSARFSRPAVPALHLFDVTVDIKDGLIRIEILLLSRLAFSARLYRSPDHLHGPCKHQRIRNLPCPTQATVSRVPLKRLQLTHLVRLLKLFVFATVCVVNETMTSQYN